MHNGAPVFSKTFENHIIFTLSVRAKEGNKIRVEKRKEIKDS